MNKSKLYIHYVIKGKGLSPSTIQNLIQNGYKKSNEQQQNINGYNRDNELSGERIQIYHNPLTNHVIANNRGTKGVNDVLTDIGLLFNYKNNKRFQHSKDITNIAKQKYKNSEFTHIGHSLGSKLANESADKNDKIISVNPAITQYDLLNNNKNEKVIRSSIDPISVLHNLQPFKSKENTIIIPNKGYNLLNEHKSQILDRIDPDMEI